MSEHYKDMRELINSTEKLHADEVAFKMKYNGAIVEIKYSKFIEDIRNLGSYLLNLNMKNNRVAIISTNRYEWCVAYLAAATSDLTVVPLDRALPESEFHSLIERSMADVVIYESKYETYMENEKKNEKSSVMKYINMDIDMQKCYDSGKVIYNKKNSPYKKVKIQNDKMRFMLFTSGTTQASKCVMLTHKNICSDIEKIIDRLDVRNTDTMLSFLPLHHTFGCTADFLYPISRGATIAFCEGLRYIVNNLNDFKVSVMISVPALIETMYHRIWKNIIDTKKETKVKVALKASEALLKVGIDVRKILFKQIHDSLGGNIRFFISGAAAISPEVIKGFEDFGIPIYQGYGLTETSPVASVENATFRRIGSIGTPLEGIKVKVDNPDEDGVGELWIKGSIVMLGYYNNEEATKEVFDHGWFKTGDLAKIDKDGYIYITGRKKNVIVLKNGKNVFPEELETLINNNIDCVKESLVYGAKLSDGDVEVRAKIVYDPETAKEKYGDLSEEELYNIFWEKIKEVNKKLSMYKYIKGLILTKEELIKTTTNKIKRFEEMKKIEEESKV